MTLSHEIILQTLQELSEWMELEDCPPVSLVVCGGTALGLLGLHPRPTRDVDVLASFDEAERKIIRIRTFDEKLQNCIRQVAENHSDLSGLGKDWINLAAGELTQWNLPDGFIGRLKKISIGPRLTLYILGRQDLTALKLYAAADDDPRLRSRQQIHLDDLKILSPTREHLLAAIHWISSLPDCDKRQGSVKRILRILGHGNLTDHV